MLIYQRVPFGSSCQSELHCHVAFQYDLPERAQHFDLRPCFYRAEPPSKMSTKSWGLKKHIQSHPTIYYLYWLSGYQNGHLVIPHFWSHSYLLAWDFPAIRSSSAGSHTVPSLTAHLSTATNFVALIHHPPISDLPRAAIQDTPHPVSSKPVDLRSMAGVLGG